MTLSTPNLFEGLGSFGDHMAAESEFRGRLAAFYSQFAGLRSAGPNEEAYEAFLFPYDTEADQTGYADGMWSCALTCLGTWRMMGVPHPALSQPYRKRVGQAVSDVVLIARKYNAYKGGNRLGGYALSGGDVFIVGEGNNLHVVLAKEVRVDEKGVTHIDVVEGGQGTKNNMAIEAHEYVLAEAPGGKLIAKRADKPSGGRPLYAGVDVWALALTAGLFQ